MGLAEAHITWAKPLAFNEGVYNLLLAIGFVWTALSDATTVSSLSTFFAIWLLGAAAAALTREFSRPSFCRGYSGCYCSLYPSGLEKGST
jgi:uncharacterized membrane protein